MGMARSLTLNEKSKGLWANIHAKRARGERMNPKGSKDAPTKKEIKMAQEEMKVDKDGIKSCGCGEDPCKTYGSKEEQMKKMQSEAIQRRMDRMTIIATDPATGRKVIKIAPKKEIGKGKNESVESLVAHNILEELSYFDTELVDELFGLFSEETLGDFIAEAMLAEEEIDIDSLS